MNRFRILAAAGMIAIGSMTLAGAQTKTPTKTTTKPSTTVAKPLTKAQVKALDKIPTWLAGKYTGYSSYMKASFDVAIDGNGLIFGRTQIGDKKSFSVNGRYHHEELIIGQKIYGVNKRDYGIQLVNEGNSQDTVELKKG